MAGYDKVELSYLTPDLYPKLKELMLTCYPKIGDAAWKKEQVNTLIDRFPKGQVVVMVDGVLAGAALSILIRYDRFDEKHTYIEMTANDTFDTHTTDGDTIYGLDMVVHPEYRGLRLGRRMYDYRKELCEEMNLKGIVLGGRLPNYHKHQD
jgi:GNAT superfamily N-acetyltransferase